MTTEKPSEFAELNTLAIEACDMWQEHLSSLASDPAARAELTRFLEPQRRLFADWAAMMKQGGVHAPNTSNSETTSSPPPSSTSAPSAAPSSRASHGDDALRVAQLALRVAELEKRLTQLESKSSSATRRA